MNNQEYDKCDGGGNKKCFPLKFHFTKINDESNERQR